MILGKRVLVAMAHADDAELGAGATIARLVEEGYNVDCVAFSRSIVSLPPDAPPDILAKEAKRSAAILGVNSYSVLDFKTRIMSENRQGILQCLIDIKQKLAPDLVITHCNEDCHQDHRTVASEVVRAFKNSTILSVAHPWNMVEGSMPNFFVAVEERHVARQIEAIGEYKSQSGKWYCRPAVTRGQLEASGLVIGTDFAQSFRAVRIIV